MKKLIVFLIHLGYWALYFVLMFFVTIMAFQNQINSGNISVGGAMFRTPFSGLIFVPAIVGFYLFYFIVFPKFLLKRKLVKTFLVACTAALLAALAGSIDLSLRFDGKTMFATGFESFFTIYTAMAFLGLVHGIIAMIIHGFISWYDEIKLKEELNKKNYEMEVALIKAQINPHFLFNTINNIDALIQKDPAIASEYLNKLSDILRFMLYEAKTDKIALDVELKNISKYLDLQKIRTNNQNFIRYEVKGNPVGFMIEPMLLMPFIENAFKHVDSKKVENAIDIMISISDNVLKFECSNVYSTNHAKTMEHGGLGNQLIERRLELLYPNKHTFSVSEVDGLYKVELRLIIN